MTKLINLPYAKKADYSIIRPIIDAGIGIGIMTGSMKLFENRGVDEGTQIVFGSMFGSVVQLMANICFLPDDSRTYKIAATDKGMACIESHVSGYSILPCFLSCSGVFISMTPMIRGIVSADNHIMKHDIAYEKAIIQFGLPIISALWKEYEFHGEKLYKHRLIDVNKKITHTHYSTYTVGSQMHVSSYETTSFATDYSKELRYLGDNQFELLHYGEPVEILIQEDLG